MRYLQEKTNKCSCQLHLLVLADKQFQRIIEELQVSRCTACQYGCPWVGVLCELKEHLANGVDGCQYASGSCEVSCSAAVTCDKPSSDQL